jgi:hypothetical protein
MNINQTLIDFFNQTAQMGLIDLYGSMLSGYLNKEVLKTAYLGSDKVMLQISESTADRGLLISSFYEGNPDDIFHPSKPLEQMNVSDYDAIILSTGDHNQDEQLVQQLINNNENGRLLTRPVYLAGKIRFALYQILAQVEDLRTCLSARKLSVVANLLLSTPSKGCIVECGTFRGGTTLFSGLMLREARDTRNYYAFDTYEGMPAPVEQDGETIFQEGTFTSTSVEEVTNYLAPYDFGSKISLKKGLVQDTITSVIDDEKEISFALIDTDQYLGTIESLKKIVPALSVNGIIIVDDYDFHAVKKAVDEAKVLFPTIRGYKISQNFYILWNKTDSNFLSMIRN